MPSFSKDEFPDQWAWMDDAELDASDAELDEIETEDPVVEAELVLLDDEIAQLGVNADTEPVVHRQIRRRRRRVLTAAASWAEVA